MTVSVGDSLIWIKLSQLLASGPTVGVVFGTTVVGEVGSLVDECSTLGVGTCGGRTPEGIAEVNDSELIGI